VGLANDARCRIDGIEVVEADSESHWLADLDAPIRTATRRDVGSAEREHHDRVRPRYLDYRGRSVKLSNVGAGTILGHMFRANCNLKSRVFVLSKRAA